MYLFSIYATNHCRTSIITEIKDSMNALELSNPQNYYLMAGDLNARRTDWGDQASNPRGGYVKNWESNSSTQYKFKILTAVEPTFIPDNTYLDLCIIANRIQTTNLVQNKLDTLDYDSDHIAITLTIRLQNDLDINFCSEPPNALNYKKTNWKKFRAAVEAQHQGRTTPRNINLTNDGIDKYLASIEQHIKNAIEETVPPFIKKK